MGEERRVHERHDLLAQITVGHRTVDHVLEIVNLSRGGALVDLAKEPRPRWLELQHEVDVRLFDGEGRPALVTRGKIVRIVESADHRLFAIQFVEIVDDEKVREVLRAAGRPPPLPDR